MTLKDKIRDWIICIFCFIIIVFAILLFPIAAIVICLLALIIFLFCIPFAAVSGVEELVVKIKERLKSKKN
jgi:predicted MFS family arabinose efflux permease